MRSIKTVMIVVITSIIATGSITKSTAEKKEDHILFIQTDKDVYQQGETLWLKAYVLTTPSYNISTLNGKMAITLNTLKGKEIYKTIINTENGRCSTNLTIPGGLENKTLILYAYFETEKDNRRAGAFKKILNIQQPLLPELLIDANFSKSLSKNNKQLKLAIKVTDRTDKPAIKAKIRYRLIKGEKILAKNKLKTDSKGLANIIIKEIMPDKNKNLIMELSVKHNKAQSGLTIPVPDTTKLMPYQGDNATEKFVKNKKPSHGMYITAKLDKQKYTAREKVTLTITTHEPDGKPCPAEISLAAINHLCYAGYNQQLNQYLYNNCEITSASRANIVVFTKDQSCNLKKHFSNYHALPGKTPHYYDEIKLKTPTLSETQRDYSSYSNVLNIIRDIKPFNLRGKKIVFPGFTNSFASQTGAIFVIDGIKMGDNINILNSLSPSDIKEVNVYTDPVETHRFTALQANGVIEIFTKRGEKQSLINNHQNKQFVAPVYNDSIKKTKKKDLRTTLFWDPDIKTGSDGKKTITFYNGDIKNKVVIVINSVTESMGSASEVIIYTIE